MYKFTYALVYTGAQVRTQHPKLLLCETRLYLSKCFFGLFWGNDFWKTKCDHCGWKQFTPTKGLRLAFTIQRGWEFHYLEGSIFLRNQFLPSMHLYPEHITTQFLTPFLGLDLSCFWVSCCLTISSGLKIPLKPRKQTKDFGKNSRNYKPPFSTQLCK